MHSDIEEWKDFFLVRCAGAKTLRFRGKLLGSAETSPDPDYKNFSGSIGCWTLMRLFETPNRKFICERVSHSFSDYANEIKEVEYEGAVCDNGEEVMAFFGHGTMAKEVYEEAYIDDTELVE